MGRLMRPITDDDKVNDGCEAGPQSALVSLPVSVGLSPCARTCVCVCVCVCGWGGGGGRGGGGGGGGGGGRVSYRVPSESY